MSLELTVITCDQQGCPERVEHRGPADELAGWLQGRGWAVTNWRYYCPGHRGERRPLVRSVPAPRESADDAALRARAAAGDRDAFGELATIYRQTVYMYVYRRCGGNRELAEDITQETLARALRRISSYREMGRGFGAWLTTIAGNLLVDHWKSGWSRFIARGFDGDEHLAVLDQQRFDDPDPAATEVIAGEAAAAVREALADLTGEQREVVELRFFSGLSVAETATKLGNTEGAVKAAQYRAVRVLARHPLLTPWAPWAVAAT